MVSTEFKNVIEIIVACIFMAVVVTILFQLFDRYILNYRITDKGIEIVLFGKIPIIRIFFNDIVKIKKISYWEIVTTLGLHAPLGFGNRFWGKMVLIHRKKGIVKMIIITPDNADLFIDEVLRRQAQAASPLSLR